MADVPQWANDFLLLAEKLVLEHGTATVVTIFILGVAVIVVSPPMIYSPLSKRVGFSRGVGAGNLTLFGPGEQPKTVDTKN